MSRDKSSKRKNERPGQDREELHWKWKKEDLQKNYDILKRDNERLVKENEGLLEQNATLIREKEKVEADFEELGRKNNSLQREKETLRRENEALQRKYDSEKKRLVKEKEALKRKYETLIKEKEKVEAEKEDLQKKYDDLQGENKTLVKEKKDLQKNYDILKSEKDKLTEDFEELQKKTNTCDYVLGREWKKMTEAHVNVTLDPDTASPSLTVSEDGSRVRFTGERSAEWPSVLGREGFTSGRHYWEVEVGEKGYWVLGVSTHPPEKSLPEKPGEGYWLVRLVKGKICTAVSQGIRSGDQSGDQILNLEKFCKVWGVYLDHEGGRLLFYNAETRSHIHTLEGSFTGQVYPIFSPGSHDKAPLIINRKVNV